MKKMINVDFVKYENNKSDEYIRLDTTIIGIDNLISKASSAEEANALFKAKDVIYSQQWYFDVTVEAEPDKGWISVEDRLPDGDGNVYEGGLEESKYVLVYGCYEDDYGYGIGTYIRDHIDHDAGWSGCLSGVYELDCCNVTHWRHLPEPPKGG